MSELFKNIRKTIADAAQNKEQRVAELKAQGLNTAGGQSTAGKTFRQVQQKNANKMTEVRQKAQERQDKVTYTEIMRRGDASPARQKLLAQQEAASKWYQGDTPTSSEALARIYTIAQEDSARAEQLYNAYIGFTQDASTPFYNPYSSATNKASAALSELGYDMSGGITKEWLEENSYLKNYYRTSDTGTNPLSPTKSSSNEQDAAYWWYQAYKAEETTEQAETEWQALQEEIAYWTNRTDRNYTDDEILAKIDWSNYKTLVKMDEGKDSGVPLTLNRSVGYSQDALKGVIWAARNGSTGSTQNDSVKAVLGAGKSYTEMQPVRRKLDATSEYYSPYSVGCTMDDEALYFGVSRFGEDWLEENKSILNGNDATAKQMYQNVYAAEQTTLEAEAELKDLQAKVDNLLKYSSDPDKILAAVDGEYKTLEKLDESMQTGKLLDTTRRINYSKGDLERYVRNQCALANAAATGKEFASTVKKVLGVGASIVKATSLGDGRDNAINAAGTTIAEAGTDAEKTAFDTAYSADFGTYVDEVNGAITNGDVNGQEMYEYSQQRADKQAATEGLDAYATVKTYETAVTERDAAIKELEETYGIYVDEDGNIDTTRMQSTEPKTSGFVKDVTLNNAKAIAAGGGSDAGLGSNPFAVGGYDMSAGELEQQKTRLAELEETFKQGGFTDYKEIAQIQKEISELKKQIAENEAKQEEAQKGDAQEPTGKKKKPSLQTQLTAVDLTEEQQKEVNKLLNTIDEANETINGTQEEYDKAQTTLKQIEDGYAAAAAIADMTGATKYDTSAMQIIESIAPIATEYVPTEWRSGNLFSLIMDYYGATYEETAAAAKKRVKANQAEIDAVNKAREELEKLGVDIGADLGVDYDNNLKRYVADLERDNKDAEYFLLGENEDFESVVKAESGKIEEAYKSENGGLTDISSLWSNITNLFTGHDGYSSLDDAILLQREALTAEENGEDYGTQNPYRKLTLEGMTSSGENANVTYLNAEECDTYLYIRGTQGEEAAKEYFEHLTDRTYGVVNMRKSGEIQEFAAKVAEEAPVAGTALAIISAPFAGAASVAESLYGSLFAEEINPYGTGYNLSNFNNTVKSNVTQDIKDNVREWATDKLSNLDVGGIKVNLSDDAVEWGAEALSWLAGASYQAGVSIGESTVYAGLLGGVSASVGAKASSAFQALGMSEKGASLLGGIVRSAVGASGQGASAAATAVQEAKLKGASDTDAQLMGGVTFIAETITEAIELETLTEAFELGGEAGKTMIERAVKTAFGGLNEAVGEGASSLIESWGDYAIMGINSDYEQKVKEYEEQGYRLDDARKAAMSDVLMDALESSAVGFISGEIGGVTGQLAGYGNNQLDLQNRINDRAAQNVQTNVQSGQTNVQNQQTAQTQHQERSMQQPLTVQDETAQNAATIAQDGQSTETDNAVQESAETATSENTAEETQTYETTYETVEQIDEAIAQKQTEVNKASRKVQSLERQLRNSRSSKTQQSLIDATSEMRRANLELEQLQQQRTEIEQRQASKPSIQTPLTVQDETTAQTESTAQENTQTEQPKRQMQERVMVQDAETAQADSAETTQAESNQTAAQETNQQKRQLQQPATMLDESRAKRTASEITTLQIAMTEADSSSMTATVGAILTEDAGNLTEKDAASAAAQNLVHRYGAKEVGNATLKMILYDNGDITGTKEALTVAGLYPNGKANGVLQEIMWNDVTAETVTQLREAAMEDLTQPDADAVISQNIHDSRVANDVVKQAGEGAFNGVQPYEDAVTKRKIERRQAENMLRQARQRLSDLRQNFVSIQQQFLNDPTNGSLMGAFASTLKDVEGQTKVVQEYEQSLTNAEQSLTEAQKQLDQKRDETVTNVRRQAEANIAEQDVQRTAEIAQRQAEEAAAQQVQENAQETVAADSTTQETTQAVPENNAENAVAADETQAEFVYTDNVREDSGRAMNDEAVTNATITAPYVEPQTTTQTTTQAANAQTDSTRPDSGENLRQFGTQTAQSTDMLFEETRKYLLNNSVYEADSNTEQIDRAIAWVREQATMSDPTGYQNAKTAVTDPSFDYTTADGQAQMLVVMRLAGQMNDVSGQTQVADVFNRQGTTIAQALQARKIFYMMNPSAQIAAIQKIADNLSEENGVPVTIPEDALKRLGEAINPNDAQRIRNEIVDDLYKQLPANWKSRLNGIRYFAMLANPRTHIRNILGNTIMKGTAYARDEINAGLERFLPKEQRTKSFWVNSDYKDAAKSLYTEVSSMFDGSGGKYNPETNRRAFNTNWLQKLADFNTNLLDKEDTIAMKGNFIHYLGGFLQARGWDVNNLTDAQKQEAVQYAFTNAEKNVYHQASKFAEWLNKLGRGKDASIYDKIGRFVIEGVLPFKKTPINIFKTGIEYSPVGLISSLTHDLYQVNQYRKTGGKKGITTAQFLQNMSSGLTGCGLMGLGAFMMANGLLTVGFKDDDPEDEYAEMTGHQEFAIELFGYSYTIDWTAPASIPLFMGAALQKEIESREEGITWENAFDVVTSTLSAIAEPMLNLTMLDGVNSTLQSISYATATGSPVGDTVVQSLMSLATQLVPTSLGAVARTIDPVRRKTYADKNSNLPTWLQYPIERVQNKLPGLSELNMPYLNAWGEEDREDSLATRIFENFVSPGYLSKIESDSVETELLSISTQTGSDLIPDLPKQSFSVDGATVNLTSEEYEQYVKTRGSKMHDALEELFATDEYKAMSLTAQKDCIEDIQEWATEQGKAAVCPGKKLTGWKATDDPVPSVVERRASEDLQAYRDEAYANIKQAVENEDATTAADWVYGLKESGVENSTIKSKMTTAYKEEYQNAAREGDRATMSRIETVLTALDVGYKQKDFSNWELDAFKE